MNIELSNVSMCITTKMATTIGLLILFSFTTLPSGHGQTPNRPNPSESSTAYVRIIIIKLHGKFIPLLQITRFAPTSPNTQMYPPTYYMETTDPGMFRCECLKY